MFAQNVRCDPYIWKNLHETKWLPFFFFSQGERDNATLYVDTALALQDAEVPSNAWGQ